MYRRRPHLCSASASPPSMDLNFAVLVQHIQGEREKEREGKEGRGGREKERRGGEREGQGAHC